MLRWKERLMTTKDKWLLISLQENEENKKVGVRGKGGGGLVCLAVTNRHERK